MTMNDGGRAAAGYQGTAGDCAVRAIAIAAERPYQEVYDLVNEFAAKESGRRKRSGARTGVWMGTMKKVMAHLGWEWTATMGIGTGCRVHLRKDELPSGRVIARVSCHYVAVVDGVVQDTYDSTREGKRCVYGYWRPKQALTLAGGWIGNANAERVR